MSDKDKPISSHLVWCDIETTGIEVEDDVILEVAFIITDWNLEEVSEFHSLVFDCNPKNLRPDNSTVRWPEYPCWSQHFESGLIEELLEQYDEGWQRAPQSDVIQKDIVAFLSSADFLDYAPPPLCGLSVHFDRSFLKRRMPKVHDMFDHRNIDVSSIRELQKRWRPEMMERMPKKIGAHRAMSDLRESIGLLRAMRSSGFVG